MLTQSLLLIAACIINAISALSVLEAGEVKLEQPGLVITQSVRIARGVYELPDPSDKGAVIVSGDDLVVDFQGATARATPL
jgi:hypothetical protein